MEMLMYLNPSKVDNLQPTCLLYSRNLFPLSIAESGKRPRDTDVIDHIRLIDISRFHDDRLGGLRKQTNTNETTLYTLPSIEQPRRPWQQPRPVRLYVD
jgi:hypothetical protein